MVFGGLIGVPRLELAAHAGRLRAYLDSIHREPQLCRTSSTPTRRRENLQPTWKNGRAVTILDVDRWERYLEERYGRH